MVGLNPVKGVDGYMEKFIIRLRGAENIGISKTYFFFCATRRKTNASDQKNLQIHFRTPILRYA